MTKQQQIKKFLNSMLGPGTPDANKTKAQLDIAIDIIISQKMTIATLTNEVRSLGRQLDCRPYNTYDPLIKHVKDW